MHKKLDCVIQKIIKKENVKKLMLFEKMHVAL